MKPKPFWSLNHLTVPLAMVRTSFLCLVIGLSGPCVAARLRLGSGRPVLLPRKKAAP
jgi:hypothetical protein